jgi:hypothetical protein
LSAGAPPQSALQAELAELLRRERQHAPGSDLDATLARNIVRAGTAYKAQVPRGDAAGRDEVGEDGDAEAVRAATSHEARLTPLEQQRRDRQRAVQAHQRDAGAAAACRLCLDSPAMRAGGKHRIISLGDHAYLALPPEGRRAVPGHLVLAPVLHCAALTACDEDVYAELNRFKQALHAHFAARGEDVIFLETCVGLARGAGAGAGAGGRHTRVEVVPMPRELAADAPLFFRKAILDEEEWVTNRQLIDTQGKGLRKCVPRGFAYFHCSWAGGGFVHPIEDEARFPASFGLDVACGMLGQDGGGGFGRKSGGRGGVGGGIGGGGGGGSEGGLEAERALVREFIASGWSAHDFTLTMDG